ncbi:threonine synthase [Desulfurococcus mucosus]|uniref:L-threonine synthase n=1 Tax=Desulfurococcus mucosus (strain ATCC 35584 / DSM 2162 / JCM 9187 / O7/1) TaxID=765177 RepID=E8R7B6_DESM0|nr:pyridoxal-phosphate dependent enzyme [Desulfurococcus mucosus]ADV65581.1 L-threonine synthase [Desulfurococcus mucosus DSM 2162]
MHWKCPYCGFEADALKEYYWKCPRCGKPLVLSYTGKLGRQGSRNIWERYGDAVPLKPEKTRGEGNTPLVSEKMDGVTVLFKLEYLNPGGSFKDRGSSLAVYYAYKTGFRSVVEDTSGNTGISVALYSRLYGLNARIYMPRTAPEGKKKAVRMLGAQVVEAPSRGEAAEMVLRETGGGAFYVAHTWSYLYILGASTIAWEVLEEDTPDYVIAPVGSGGLFLGLVKGFEKALEAGWITKMPRFIAVQGYSTQPVHKAFKGVEQPGEESTLADGIMVPNPPRLEEIVEALRRYQGDILLVGNTEVEKAWRELWELGFLVEPTSAAAYAALSRSKNQFTGRKTLVVLTGSGLKTLTG